MNQGASLSEHELEELVAYLDGELSPQRRQEIEQRLVSDEAFRRQSQQLERAWDFLDELPESEVDDSFTHSTVEMVAVSASRDFEETVQQRRKRLPLKWMALGGIGIVAISAGYYLAQRQLSAPNRQLQQDLPIIEEIDLYRVSDSLEFLEKLDEEGLFHEESVDEVY